MIGNDPNRAATASRSAARLRCCQSGARAPGRRGGLAKPGREHRRGAELPDDEAFDLVGVGHEERRVRGVIAFRHPHDEPIVAPHHFGIDAAFVAQARRDGHGPRRVHPAAEGGEHRDAPVAELVGRTFDEDGAIVGDGVHRPELVVEILKQVLGGEAIQPVFALQSRQGCVGGVGAEIPHQLADGAAQLDRPARALAFPERHLARLPWRGRHEHAIVGDLFDAPRGRAEQEGFAGARFEDHLLVELTDARDVAFRAREEHAVEAPVRDRACVGDGHALGALPRDHRAVDAVPGDARPQLRELVRGITARQHVEHALEDPPAQVRVRRRAPDGGEELVHRPAVHRRHGDDLLGQHVEGIARIPRWLDQALGHRPGHGSAGQQVAAELREDDAGAGFADAVPGPADALQSARDRRRRLDLHHEIDGAHIDAELER
jgi:hypothetical protein